MDESGPSGPRARSGGRRIENGGRTRCVLRNLEEFQGDLVGFHGTLWGCYRNFMGFHGDLVGFHGTLWDFMGLFGDLREFSMG